MQIKIHLTQDKEEFGATAELFNTNLKILISGMSDLTVITLLPSSKKCSNIPLVSIAFSFTLI